METISITPGTRAYSYRRFSSAAQSDGDSLRRQTALAEQFSEKHGLVLDTDLSFEDLGVSAYKGRNRKDGALSDFMHAVDEGRVPKGSYLLVENLDRLSRQKIHSAFSLFIEILGQGIKIATLIDDHIYSNEELNLNDLMMSLMSLHRANEESEVKSKRLKAVWAAKRSTASHIKMTSSCPHWLRLKDDRSGFDILSDKAKAVRKVYELYLNGMGKAAIARHLNEAEVLPIGTSNGWHHSYITKLLKNIAVIGNFQPHHTESIDGKRKDVPDGQPIEGYYPPIIDRATFYRAQKQRESHALPRGRRGEGFPNLLRGIAKCQFCGGTMHYISKGKRRGTSGRPDVYLQCSNAKRRVAGCLHTSLWNYYAVEYFVIHGISDIDFTKLFPDIMEENRKNFIKAEADHDTAIGDLKTVEDHLSKLTDAVMSHGLSHTLSKRLSELEARQSELETQVEHTLIEVEAMREALQTIKQRFSAQDDLLVEWESNKGDPLLRSKLNRALASTIDVIDFHVDPSDFDFRSIRINFNKAGGGRVWNIIVEPVFKRGQYHGSTIAWDDRKDGKPGGSGVHLFYPPEIEDAYWLEYEDR